MRCFERAAEIDPTCAMANWGKANAFGPNYNGPEITPEAYAEERASLALAEHCVGLAVDADPVERDLIAAQAVRYPEPSDSVAPVPDDRAYAAAMRALHAKCPDDADVAALTAEALIQLRPWKLWSPEGVPAPELPEIRRVLEDGLERWPDHPALCHLYIHAMEAGPEVGKAVPAADRLRTLIPGLGHLVHMPSRIYIWNGRYQDEVETNQDAVAVDRAFVEYAGRNNVYTLYRLHNYDFIAYGGMWSGQREVALAAARELVDEIPPEALENMTDLVDIFVATPYHVMVRFGMWDESLAEPEPAPELLAARAVGRYARGIALASLGRTEEATEEYEAFRRARQAVPETRLLFNNQVSDILAVADAVLPGEIECRAGHTDRAFELLRKAVELDEKLNYDEPWGWMEPARHALGALLVEQGRCAEAMAVYEANLERYPNNGWALHGLAECMEKTGHPLAGATRARFEEAWVNGETEIPGSCFCRTRD